MLSFEFSETFRKLSFKSPVSDLFLGEISVETSFHKKNNLKIACRLNEDVN